MTKMIEGQVRERLMWYKMLLNQHADESANWASPALLESVRDLEWTLTKMDQLQQALKLCDQWLEFRELYADE